MPVEHREAARALLLRGHQARGETAHRLGFRVDNLRRASIQTVTYVGPLLLALASLGLALDLHRELPIPGLLGRSVAMPIFGIVQQYLLLGFYRRRFQELCSAERTAVLASASVFAALHAPLPWLIAVTFFAGIGACWLYKRAPNLWLLGIAHGLLSLTLALFLADLLPNGLKVGARAIR